MSSMFKNWSKTFIPAPQPKATPAPVNKKPGVKPAIPRGPHVEQRNPPNTLSWSDGKLSGGGQDAVLTPLQQGMSQGKNIWSQYGMIPTADQFKGIAARYQDALQGLNSNELAAQRAQSAEEINAQTGAAQRALRVMQGQQGIQGAAAQAGMMGLANQGQKAVAGAERDLLLKNQQIQQQALANYNNFMQGERGGLLGGMLQFGDMSQKAAADAEMRGLLGQFLGQAQTQAQQAQDAMGGGGGGSVPWWQNPATYTTPQGWWNTARYANPMGPYSWMVDQAAQRNPTVKKATDWVSNVTGGFKVP